MNHGKRICYFYTDEAVIVPIKAEFYAGSHNRAYQATFPQFFGGTVTPFHTLSHEVREESQGQLTLSDSASPIYHLTIGGKEYTFYSQKLSELPRFHPLQTTGHPANQLEMQDILVFTKTIFEGTFTVDKLLELCRAINPLYCDRTKCSDPSGHCQWDDEGTKDAFTVFLSKW